MDDTGVFSPKDRPFARADSKDNPPEIPSCCVILSLDHTHLQKWEPKNSDRFGEPFVLRVGLEPLPNSEVREIVDVVRQVVRPVTDEEDE